jgi:2-polyprenyl-3-methyl-5-hydroxy-6-metoxy-1,4-benzoquinol methylase
MGSLLATAARKRSGVVWGALVNARSNVPGREHSDAPEQHGYQLPYHWCMSAFHHYVTQCGVSRIAPILRGKRVLEVGCGDGYVTALLAGHACRVHAFDLSERAIAFARLIVEEPKVTFAVGGAEDLARMAACLDSEVDVIAAFEVIEHLSESVAATLFSTARRLLHPRNGCIVLTTPNGARRAANRNPHHAQEFTRRELTAVLRDAGFEDIHISGLYMQPPWTRLEHFANTVPFRAGFRALARTGARYPDWCRTLVCVATTS